MRFLTIQIKLHIVMTWDLGTRDLGTRDRFLSPLKDSCLAVSCLVSNM